MELSDSFEWVVGHLWIGDTHVVANNLTHAQQCVVSGQCQSLQDLWQPKDPEPFRHVTTDAFSHEVEEFLSWNCSGCSTRNWSSWLSPDWLNSRCWSLARGHRTLGGVLGLSRGLSWCTGGLSCRLSSGLLLVCLLLLLSMLSCVKDALLLEQFEDVGDNQTCFMLAESHGTKVAFEAVQGGLLLLLLLKEHIIEPSISQPSL